MTNEHPLFGRNMQVGFAFLTSVLPLMLESSSMALPADYSRFGAGWKVGGASHMSCSLSLHFGP